MLNWLARYAAVIDHVVDADGRPRTSVLDVGCGPHGLALPDGELSALRAGRTVLVA